jgi:prepilin-type N-terminal cleavage/methylation domain-containing protein
MVKLRNRLGDLIGLITRKQLNKRSKEHERGFTLMELLIVLAIFGIVAGIGVVRFQTAQAHQELDRAVRELTADIRWMQQLSANDATPRLTDTTPLTYRYRLVVDANHYEVRDGIGILKARQFGDDRVRAANNVNMTFYAYDLDRLRNPADPTSLENAVYQVRLTHNLTGAVRDVNVAARIGRVWINP